MGGVVEDRAVQNGNLKFYFQLETFKSEPRFKELENCQERVQRVLKCLIRA